VVDVDTVGGLISSRLGRLPNLRDQITLDDVTIRVESVVGNGVRMVSITLTPEQIAHLSGAALPAKTASAVEPTSGEATLKNAAIQ
jgi:Mg2+/Co2+ transporter CorC